MDDNNNNLEDRPTGRTALPVSVDHIRVTDFESQGLIGICIVLKNGGMIGSIALYDNWVETLVRLLSDIAIGEAEEMRGNA